MYREHRIAVLVPAYNEQTQIPSMLGTMPAFVDAIAVIDDGSTDLTPQKVIEWQQSDARIALFQHGKNRGVGAALTTGYLWAKANGFCITAVMAADGQMRPQDLAPLLDPVVEGQADFTKGNRFASPGAWQKIPWLRLVGNWTLSWAVRLITGYWHVFDSQSGYTAISRPFLERVDWSSMYHGYGQPLDLLARLSALGARVLDVPQEPVYGVGERSKLRIARSILPIAWLVFRWFFRLRVQLALQRQP